MATCPNKSLESWKMLVASRGEAMAYFLWDKYNGEVPESESRSETVKASLKVVDRLLQLSFIKEDKRTRKYGELNEPERLTIRLNTKSHPYREINLRKTLQNKGVTNQQIDFIFDYMKSNNIQEISTEQLALEIASNYSYNVEINTATKLVPNQNITSDYNENPLIEIKNNKAYEISPRGELIERPDILVEPKKDYINLTVPGGTNYTNNEIATPAITPSIKGHAVFSTDNGIGWFRSDDKVSKGTIEEYQEEIDGELVDRYITLGEKSDTRRILELQSDLFQKSRGKENLVDTGAVTDLDQIGFYYNGSYYESDAGKYFLKDGKNISFEEFEKAGEDYEKLISKDKKNQFLQLLNKDNNWITFFIKSIIQDSVKKGYEKVLFPTGNTASKVEGHSTLEEFKKQKEDRIKELEKELVDDNLLLNSFKSKESINFKSLSGVIQDKNNEVNQLKQELERVEREGFGALRPIFNFYENTVTNILKKRGYSPVTVTDEFGNSWNEVVLSEERDNQEIFFQLNSKKILEPAIQELDDYLLKFMKSFGVNSKQFDNLKDKIGVDALGATDVLNKLIWYTKNRNAETVPEEVGHMAVMLMGENHPDINDLLSNIQNWSEYKDVYNEYMDIYKDESKVKIEAIGKLLAKSLVSNYNKTGLDKNLLEKAYSALKNLIERIISGLDFANVFVYNEKIADKIALNILSGNKEYIRKITNLNPNLDYKFELQSNPLASSIINKFAGKNVKVTGSIALSAHGENIRRPQGEGLHDVDFKVNSFEEYTSRILPQIEKLNSVPAHYGWHKKNYSTYAFLIAEEGYTFKVLERKDDFSNGWITSYELYDKNGNQVEVTQKNVVAVDFFVYKEAEKGDFDTTSIFTPGSSVYAGKMSLGGKSNPYFFSREKDQEDYVLRKPTSFTPTENSIYYQKDSTQSSTASNDTINKVKEAAKQMGIRIQELTEYAKSNPNVDVTNVNGVADLVKGVIAVSQGRENVALTEEMVHIATAIIEQVNPKLITDLISKIDRFAIFGKTLQEYKGKKAYQLSNGKPDIRKIKKEAVDKLIAELIINNSEGSTEFPELLLKENRSLVQRMWGAIIDFLRGMYKKTDIDLFSETAQQIITGNVGGTVDNISSSEIFYQVNQNTAVDKIYDFIKNIDSRMELVNDNDPETRHYTLDGNKLGDSVTKRLKAKSKKVFNRTPEQQAIDDQKREWGSAGHKFLEDYINTVLIDKNGYKLEKKNDDVILNTSLNPETQVAIMTFANELIDSYPAGTRFMSEVKVVNEKVKGGMPSTLDFVAIEPVTSLTGEQDYKIDVLDWKFTSLDASITDDIPWFKQKEWKEQMGEYTKILYNYGVERKNVRKTRMLPFIVNYEYLVPGDKLTPLVAKSVEIGKLDSLTETKMYLLPVPTNTETTGNVKIDSLLKSLRIYWEKMYKLQVSPEQKADKDLMMNQISNAIRKLQMNLNFEPLIGVAETFMKNVKVTLEELEKTNISDLSEEQLKTYLGELLSFQKSAEKFINIDDVYLSNISQDNMTDKEASLFKRLRNVSGATKTMLSKISDIQKEVAVNLGLKENITTEQSKLTVLEAEREIGGLDKSFLESSKLSSKIIQVATSMIIKAKSILNIQYSRMADEFEKIILPLEQEAKAKGVDAFSLIGRTTDKGLKLINKIDSEFLKEIKKAKKDKNKEFLLKNLDLEGYVEAVSKVIEASTATIKRTHFSDNEEENEAKQTAAIIKLSRSLDIQRKDFDGYDDYQFNYFYRQFMNEEDHLSNEYKNMSENALKVWEYFTNLNKEGRKLGYLDRQGMTFFPMIEATTIQKVIQSGNILGESKDFFKDMYSIIPDEEIGFAKIDEETGELKKEVPKFFLRTNKQTQQLSKDLKRVGLLWTKSLMEYKNARNLEDTLLTLHSVEKVKGSLIVDTSGNVVFDGSHPSINEKENRNADVLMTIINDSIYGITEDLSSLGNRVLSTTVSKVSGNVDTIEERTMSTKKALKTGDTLVRSLALGLKPLVGIANWFGTQMQAYVNSGGMYTNLEFQKNNLKVMNPLGLRLEEKALIDLIVPLSGEDVVTQKLRNISLKNSIPSYLSTWSFTDVMMITNSFGERKLELANALSILDNSMIIDNKIVNIRQYLREQDRQKRKDLTESQRKELEKSFETRVNDLKEKQSLTKVAKIIDGKLSLGEEVSDLELAKLRIKIIEFGRNLNGQMSNDDKMGYRRDTIFSSFMMFKGWIPKQISVRAIDLRKNTSLDEWEYGRARAFINTIQHVGLKSSKDLFDILAGTDKGLAIINQMLIEKKHNYYLKTGKVLEITEEEFQDLIRTQIKNQLKELAVLVGTTALLITAKAAEPPEEASDLEKNRYKYWAKLTNKMYDEISFYYNPASADEMTRGSILPSLGLISKVLSFFKALGKEGYYYAIDDEKSQDKTYPTKYFINLIPVAAQLQNEVLPLVDPELAKEMGVRVTSQSRRQ